MSLLELHQLKLQALKKKNSDKERGSGIEKRTSSSIVDAHQASEIKGLSSRFSKAKH